MNEEDRAVIDFLESMDDIKSIAASQENKMTPEEVKMYIGMSLDDKRMKAVYAYLNEAGISIEGYDSAKADTDRSVRNISLNGRSDEKASYSYESGNKISSGHGSDAEIPASDKNGTERQYADESCADISAAYKPCTGRSSAVGKNHGKNNDPQDTKAGGRNAASDDFPVPAVRIVTDKENKKGIPSDDKLRHRSRSLELYRDEIGKIGDQDISGDIYEGLISGKKECADHFTEKMLPRVTDMAQAFKDEDVFDEDIISEGNLGLARAVMHVMTHGSDFTLGNGSPDIGKIDRFVIDEARKAMTEMINSENNESDLTKEVITKINLLHEARQYMKDTIGREADIFELAEYTGMDREEIEELDRLAGSGSDNK